MSDSPFVYVGIFSRPVTGGLDGGDEVKLGVGGAVDGLVNGLGGRENVRCGSGEGGMGSCVVEPLLRERNDCCTKCRKRGAKRVRVSIISSGSGSGFTVDFHRILSHL